MTSAELRQQYVELRDRVFARTNGRCFYCGTIPSEFFSDRQLDHVIPRGFAGSSDEEWNLVAACSSCNCIKSTHNVELFRERCARAHAGWPNFTTWQLVWLEAQGIKQPPRFVFYGETLGLSLSIGPPE